jgi:hypothetical protein
VNKLKINGDKLTSTKIDMVNLVER